MVADCEIRQGESLFLIIVITLIIIISVALPVFGTVGSDLFASAAGFLCCHDVLEGIVGILGSATCLLRNLQRCQQLMVWIQLVCLLCCQGITFPSLVLFSYCSESSLIFLTNSRIFHIELIIPCILSQIFINIIELKIVEWHCQLLKKNKETLE